MDNDDADDVMSGTGGEEVICSDEEFIDDETNEIRHHQTIAL